MQFLGVLWPKKCHAKCRCEGALRLGSDDSFSAQIGRGIQFRLISAQWNFLPRVEISGPDADSASKIDRKVEVHIGRIEIGLIHV